MVVHGRRGQRAVVLLDDLLRLPNFELVAPGVTAFVNGLLARRWRRQPRPPDSPCACGATR
jgi:hypothetical protein